MAARHRIVAAVVGAFVVGAAIGACGSSRSPCAAVICEGGRVCDEATGVCKQVVRDAGSTDAGNVDAGPSSCSPACTAPSVCNSATKMCVECVTADQCSCPTTVCQGNVCVAPSGTVAAPGDTCATAPTLRTCGGPIAFTVDLATASNDLRGSCAAATNTGKDVVTAITLDATFNVTVTAKASAGSFAQPVISLRRAACDTGLELACADALGQPATFTVKSLPAGTYFVIIDSYDAASAGSVDVTITFDAPTLPANETCATAAPLATDGGAVALDLSGANDDLQVSCNASGVGPDAVYTVDLATAADLVVSASGTGAGLNPVLALRTSCGVGPDLRCANALTGGSETLVVRNLAAGRYYLVAEEVGRPSAASLSLTAVTSPPTPPPSNDTCAAPRAITFAPNTTSTTFVVDTGTASDDLLGTCNRISNSPDVVYTVSLGGRRTLTATATAQAGSNTKPVVYVRTQVCESPLDAGTASSDAGTDGGVDGGSDAGVTVTNELACGNSAGASTTVTLALDPGTYFLVIEGVGDTGAGPTDVTVSLAP